LIVVQQEISKKLMMGGEGREKREMGCIFRDHPFRDERTSTGFKILRYRTITPRETEEVKGKKKQLGLRGHFPAGEGCRQNPENRKKKKGRKQGWKEVHRTEFYAVQLIRGNNALEGSFDSKKPRK